MTRCAVSRASTTARARTTLRRVLPDSERCGEERETSNLPPSSMGTRNDSQATCEYQRVRASVGTSCYSGDLPRQPIYLNRLPSPDLRSRSRCASDAVLIVNGTASRPTPRDHQRQCRARSDSAASYGPAGRLAARGAARQHGLVQLSRQAPTTGHAGDGGHARRRDRRHPGQLRVGQLAAPARSGLRQGGRALRPRQTGAAGDTTSGQRFFAGGLTGRVAR